EFTVGTPRFPPSTEAAAQVSRYKITKRLVDALRSERAMRDSNSGPLDLRPVVAVPIRPARAQVLAGPRSRLSARASPSRAVRDHRLCRAPEDAPAKARRSPHQ